MADDDWNPEDISGLVDLRSKVPDALPVTKALLYDLINATDSEDRFKLGDLDKIFMALASAILRLEMLVRTGQDIAEDD